MNNSMIIMAIHQLTGYGHASSGYSIVDLAESMGLTVSEWEIIKLTAKEILKDSEILELDEHFQPAPKGSREHE